MRSQKEVINTEKESISSKLTVFPEELDAVFSDILKIFAHRGIPVCECELILKKLIEMVSYTPYSLTDEEIDEWVPCWSSGYDQLR